MSDGRQSFGKKQIRCSIALYLCLWGLAIANPQAPPPIPTSPSNQSVLPNSEKSRPDSSKADNPLAVQQAQVAERFRRLEELLLRAAELESANNPTRSALLQQAAQQGKQAQLADLLARAAKSLEQGQFSQAIDDQKTSRENLKRLLELLQSENRQDRVREQRDEVRRWIEETDRLLRLQISQRGRTEGGQDQQQAAKDQSKLADKARDIAKQLGGDDPSKSRSPDSPAAQGQHPKSENKPQEESSDSDNPDKSKSPSSDAKKADETKPTQSPASPEKSDQKSQSPPSNSEQKSKDSEQGSKDSKQKSKDSGQQSKDPSTPSQSQSPKDQSQSAQDRNNPQSTPDQPSEKSQAPQPGQQQQPSQQQQPPSSLPDQPKDTPPQDPTQRAQERLERAQQKMKDAQKNLEESKRNEAIERQLEAEEQLRAAIEELEEILRQLREEEIERSLAALETRLRLMLEMQGKVLVETKRLQEIAGDQANRQIEIRASNLSLEERKILSEGERAQLLLREEGSSVAFPEAMVQVVIDIQSVVDRLAKADVGKMTVAIEQEIVSALEEMVQALAQVQKEQKDRRERQQQQQPQQQMPPGEQPLVDKLAELRLIRTLQVRVNKRTSTLSEMLKDPNDQVGQAEAVDILQQIRELAQRQSSVQRVTRDIVTGKAE